MGICGCVPRVISIPHKNKVCHMIPYTIYVTKILVRVQHFGILQLNLKVVGMVGELMVVQWVRGECPLHWNIGVNLSFGSIKRENRFRGDFWGWGYVGLSLCLILQMYMHRLLIRQTGSIELREHDGDLCEQNGTLGRCFLIA